MEIFQVRTQHTSHITHWKAETETQESGDYRHGELLNLTEREERKESCSILIINSMSQYFHQ